MRLTFTRTNLFGGEHLTGGGVGSAPPRAYLTRLNVRGGKLGPSSPRLSDSFPQRTPSSPSRLLSPRRVRSEVGQSMWSAQVARTTPGTVTALGRWGASPMASPREGTKRRAGQVILVTEALEPPGASAAWTLAQGAVSVGQHLCHLPLRLPFLPGASSGSPEGRVLSLEPHLDKWRPACSS